MIAFLNFGYVVLFAFVSISAAVIGFIIGNERGAARTMREWRRVEEDRRIRAEVARRRRQHFEDEYTITYEELELETARPGEPPRPPRPPKRGHGRGHDRTHPPH